MSNLYRRRPEYREQALYYTEDEYFSEVWGYVQEIGVENVRGVVIQFVDWRGDIYFRTIPTTNIYTFFEAGSNTSIGQPIRGSDVVPEVYELDRNSFVIRYITYPVVAGKGKTSKMKNSYFKIKYLSEVKV